VLNEGTSPCDPGDSAEAIDGCQTMKEVAAQARFNPAFLDTFAWLNVKILLVIAIVAPK
jgi:hypothetical protein